MRRARAVLEEGNLHTAWIRGLEVPVPITGGAQLLYHGRTASLQVLVPPRDIIDFNVEASQDGRGVDTWFDLNEARPVRRAEYGSTIGLATVPRVENLESKDIAIESHGLLVKRREVIEPKLMKSHGTLFEVSPGSLTP